MVCVAIIIATGRDLTRRRDLAGTDLVVDSETMSVTQSGGINIGQALLCHH
jgi:hypothetical protein